MKIRVSPDGAVAVQDVNGVWDQWCPSGEFFEPEWFMDREVEGWEEFEFKGERA